ARRGARGAREAGLLVDVVFRRRLQLPRCLTEGFMRIIETEWLDSLAPSDPRAEHARRDLRRVNTIMGNARHIATALEPRWREGMRVADLGAGDGSLMKVI